MAEKGIKLYPPYVEGILPAQSIAAEEDKITTLIVPFEINKAVSWADLGETKKASLILKTVSTGRVLIDGLVGDIVTYDPSRNASLAHFSIPKEENLTKYKQAQEACANALAALTSRWNNGIIESEEAYLQQKKETTAHYDMLLAQYSQYNLKEFTPLAGQYYKVQIAFISDDGTVGYYSDVGIVKYTNIPDISIEGLNTGLNASLYDYTGVYTNSDITEKVYSYTFTICDSASGIVHDTSGECLHNSSLDTIKGQSRDTWNSCKVLDPERQYTIEYKIKTLNGYEASMVYTIMAVDTLELVAKNTEFIATQYRDDGYIHIHMLPKDEDSPMHSVTGNFILVRASSEDNFESWQEVTRFTLINNYPLLTLWRDFTVQQGHYYKYAIQAYNSHGVFSNRLECVYYEEEAAEKADEFNRRMWDYTQGYRGQWHFLQEPRVTSYGQAIPTKSGMLIDFEDMYLYDGERQLKIRYNPKVGSFKRTLLEAKLDTLGGKYPFIFRNGNVDYKEFSISGLITMLSDENNLFSLGTKKTEASRLTTPETKSYSGPLNSAISMSAENFKKEREFKTEVLHWLTNGKPKLFRSPAEGNFIVRLLNTSLSPNDTLGRMLHTFQSTAYEVQDYSFKNLKAQGLMDCVNSNFQELKFKMLDAKKVLNVQYKTLSIDGGAFYLAILEQYGDWMLQVNYANGTSNYIFNAGNSTGQYVFDREALASNPIVSIKYMTGSPDPGAKILYGYYDNRDIAFSLVRKVDRETVVRQFVGHPATNFRPNSNQLNCIDVITKNISYQSEYAGLKKTLGKFYYLKAEPRVRTTVYLYEGQYYIKENLADVVTLWDDTAIYEVKSKSGDDWISEGFYSGRPSNDIKMLTFDYNLRFNSKKLGEEFVTVGINGGNGNPATSSRYEIMFDLDDVESLYIGNAVVCEVCYNIHTITYECEVNEKYSSIIHYQNLYNEAVNNYTEVLRRGMSEFNNEAEELRQIMERAYLSYLSALRRTLDEIQEEEYTYYAL